MAQWRGGRVRRRSSCCPVRASEALLGGSAAAFGSIVRCQRYFNVYGPRQDPHSPYSGVISRFVAKLMAGEAPTIFGDGAQTRDFVHVGDVARANVLAATLPGIFSGSSNICTGVPTTINDLAKALGTLVPHAPLPTYAPSVRGDIRYSLGNPQAAARDLGFVHRLGLTEGLASLLED